MMNIYCLTLLLEISNNAGWGNCFNDFSLEIFVVVCWNSCLAFVKCLYK